MQGQSNRPVKTFTIGFHDQNFNEAGHAKAVANHLGTDHTELYLTAEDALSVIPRLPTLFDEPFADSSQIPTFLVSQLAKQHVTVALSGDAGDEVFAGYNRYTFAKQLWGYMDRVPRGMRNVLGDWLQLIEPEQWTAGFGYISKILPASLRSKNLGDKIHKGAGVLGSETLDLLYLDLISHWKDPERLVINSREPQTVLSGLGSPLPAMDGISRMMALDVLTYLPDDILVKVDRAAMGVSLESRVPMLDHRVVAFSWRLSLDLKLRGNVSKWPLREILYRHVPKAMIERPKMGFGVPISAWLRGPLRAWAEGLLAPDLIRQQGILDAALVGQKWEEHISGKRDWQYLLWDVLMFQAWLGENGPVS
jgi:asparagine synthase (glutamine-hydrolysing)